MQRALSYYNTGNQQKGFANGYIARVVAQVRLKVPALIDGPIDPNGSASGSSSSGGSVHIEPAPARAQLIQSAQQQNQPAGNAPAQLGEPGAAAQIEAGALPILKSVSTYAEPQRKETNEKESRLSGDAKPARKHLA